MKNLIVILISLTCLNLMAANDPCQDEVQGQVDALTASDYSIDVKGVIKNQSSFNANIYNSEIPFNSANQNIKTFRADSSAIGCYGSEYIVVDETSCQVLAIGNGYCD
jgi:hypothetical protein